MRQGLIPGLTSGLIDAASPEAGSILPQPFAHAGRFVGRLDDLTGATMRTVAIEPLSPGERAAIVDALMPLGGVLLQLGETGLGDGPLLNAIDNEDVMSSWLRAAGQRIAIARPDHYVYATASSAAEAVGLLQSLRKWLVHLKHLRQGPA